MRLQEGVDLHFIPSTQFTTNRIQFRFAAPLSEETVAGRVLVANLLEMTSKEYPTAQQFRRRLAALYGANLSTSVNKIGRVHVIDVSMTYLKDGLIKDLDSLTEEILGFLSSVLLQPHVDKDGFVKDIFEIEKQQLIHYLESEIEDHFYHADKELDALFFQEEEMKLSRSARIDLVQKETSKTVYQAYKNMLKLDKIDIFVLGEVDKGKVLEALRKFDFSYRNPSLSFSYQQESSNITKEKIERRDVKQSIIELGFSLQPVYNKKDYPALLLFNGILGDSSYSKLFVTIREEKGLAYTIGSSLHFSSGLLRVYAGIDRVSRLETIRLIQQELRKIRKGQITKEELQGAKSSLIQSLQLSQDRQHTLVELAYQKLLYGEKWIELEELIVAIQDIEVDDIRAVAQKVRLEALYFMEGREN